MRLFALAVTAAAAFAACASFGSVGEPGGADASAAADANADAEADALAPPPSPTEAGTSPCGADAGHLVCDDFDEGSLFGLGLGDLNVIDGGGATIALVAGGRSPPNAANLRQAAISADGGSCVGIAAIGNGSLSTAGTVTLGFDLLLRASAPSDETAIAQLALNGYEISVRVMAGQVTYALYFKGGKPKEYVEATPFVPVPPSAWTHVTVAVDLTKGTLTFGTAEAPGTPVPLQITNYPPATPTVPTELYIGLPCTQGVSAPFDFDIDNVVLDPK